MECWPPQEAAHHIRLLCVPALQQAINSKFTCDDE